MQWVLNTRWYTLVRSNVSGHLELPVVVTGKSMMVVNGVWCSVEWCWQKRCCSCELYRDLIGVQQW